MLNLLHAIDDKIVHLSRRDAFERTQQFMLAALATIQGILPDPGKNALAVVREPEIVAAFDKALTEARVSCWRYIDSNEGDGIRVAAMRAIICCLNRFDPADDLLDRLDFFLHRMAEVGVREIDMQRMSENFFGTL